VIFKDLLGASAFPSAMKTRISNSLIVGAILGVVVLGYTSDMFSRKAGLLVTSSLVAIGTLMSTVALSVNPSQNMLWYFVIARGIAGFGVGGEYPPSAAAGIEESDDVSSNGRDRSMMDAILTSSPAVNEKIPGTALRLLHDSYGDTRWSDFADHLSDLSDCQQQ
jgi:MFS family permease